MMDISDKNPQAIIDLAKQLLMEHRCMSEPEAHRYLQTQSMNRRLAKRTVAIQIIHQYRSQIIAS